MNKQLLFLYLVGLIYLSCAQNAINTPVAQNAANADGESETIVFSESESENIIFDMEDYCQEGWGPDLNNTCRPCPTGCKTCDPMLICTLCLDNYFYSEWGLCGMAANCSDSNCALCYPNGKCIECNINFFVKSDSTCGACATNCEACINYDTCFFCSDNYTLILDGKCGLTSQISTACQNNCAACIGSTCLQCQTGWQFDTTNGCTIQSVTAPTNTTSNTTSNTTASLPGSEGTR